MGNSLELRQYFCLLFCFFPVHLQGLEVLDPEEVEYVQKQAKAVPGGSVVLDCGAVMPTIFIWSYSKPGIESNQALAYNYGHGLKVQPLAKNLGDMDLLSNSSTMVINNLLGNAEGLYTCQALYDGEDKATIKFYYNHLDFDDKGDRGKDLSNSTLT